MPYHPLKGSGPLHCHLRRLIIRRRNGILAIKTQNVFGRTYCGKQIREEEEDPNVEVSYLHPDDDRSSADGAGGIAKSKQSIISFSRYRNRKLLENPSEGNRLPASKAFEHRYPPHFLSQWKKLPLHKPFHLPAATKYTG